MILPAEAWQLLDTNCISFATIVTLNASEYLELIQSLSTRDIGGGIVYDAVIAKVAKVSEAD